MWQEAGLILGTTTTKSKLWAPLAMAPQAKQAKEKFISNKLKIVENTKNILIKIVLNIWEKFLPSQTR